MYQLPRTPPPLDLELYPRVSQVGAAGGNGYHLQASDLAGIQEKFEEIAALMEDTGLDEHL